MQCIMVICEFLPKTAYPIVFTEEGIVISEISVSKNAWSPIDSMPFSIVTEERALQTKRRTYDARILHEDDVHNDDLHNKHAFSVTESLRGKPRKACCRARV